MSSPLSTAASRFRSFSWVKLPCLAFLSVTGSALAAPVTWDPPQPISDASDVSLEGVYFGSWAPYNGTANASPVNGVTFQGYDTLGISSTNLGNGGKYFVTHTTPDTNYNTLLDYAAYANGTDASFTLNGNGARALTVGRKYLVQFWVSDPRTLASARSETISGSDPLAFPADGSGMGHFVIGRFTADDVTQEFDLAADASAQINLLQVRDVTPAVAGSSYFSAASGASWDTATTAAWSSVSGGPYNKTWTAAGKGTAVFQGTAGSVSVSEGVDASGLSFTVPGYDLTGAGTVALNDAAVVDTGSGTATIEVPITGLGGLNKKGSGTLVLTAVNTWAGPTSLTAGILELNRDEDANYTGATTITGGGTLRKTGAGLVMWGESAATFAMAADSLIDVQAGSFKGGSNANDDWTANQSSLNVADGATFFGTEANIRVNALTGAGMVKTGYPLASYTGFTVGAGNGGGTFDGVIADDISTGNLTKTGTGTQILTGLNTYTGTTTVEGGVLSLANAYLSDTATVSIAAGAALNLTHTEVDTIGRLILNNVPATAGRWGGAGSVAAGKADYESPLLTGSGVLLVTIGDAPNNSAYFSGATGSVWDTASTAAWSAASGGPYNKTWSSLTAGRAVFEGTPATVTVQGTVIVKAMTFTVPGYTLTGDGLSLNNGGTIDTGAGAVTIGNVIGGAGVEKLGTGTLTLSGLNTYSGPTKLTAGTLELAYEGDTVFPGDTTFTGSGTLLKSGSGEIQWGASKAVFAMSPGSLIDVESGTFKGGSTGNDDWTNNFSNLKVADGAVFRGTEANIRLNTLSGTGTIRSGYGGAGYSVFTFGVGDGNGTFDGALADDLSPGNYLKAGTGKQILNGANTYTGSTTVSAGTLSLSTPTLPDGGTVTIAAGALLELTHTDMDDIGKLMLDTTVAANGRWGSPGSVAAGKADYESDLISGSGILRIGGAPGSPAYDDWAATYITGINPGADASPGGDPDGDGRSNLAEFAFDSDPLSGGGNLSGIVGVNSVGGAPVLTLTLPVRSGATFTASGGAAQVSAAIDGVIYRIEGSRKDLADWSLAVTEVTGAEATAIQSALPAIDDGWTYRTFRAPGTTLSNGTGFLRAKITTP